MFKHNSKTSIGMLHKNKDASGPKPECHAGTHSKSPVCSIRGRPGSNAKRWAQLRDSQRALFPSLGDESSTCLGSGFGASPRYSHTQTYFTNTRVHTHTHVDTHTEKTHSHTHIHALQHWFSKNSMQNNFFESHPSPAGCAYVTIKNKQKTKLYLISYSTGYVW